MIEVGKKVRAHYRGTLDDGTQFDSSYDRNEPIEFVVGVGQMIPGFDTAVLSMDVGECKTIDIPTAEAYGEYREDLVQKIPMEYIPNAEELPIGESIYMPTGNGQMARCKVVEVADGMATFDLNHELAGKDLTFCIELIEVLD